MESNRVKSFKYYLRFERNYSIRTEKQYVRNILDWKNSPLTPLEFCCEGHFNTRLAALKSWVAHSKENDIWIETAHYRKETRKIPVTLSHHEIFKLFKVATGVDKGIIEFLYGSGLRVSELITLRTAHITGEGVKIINGKGSKERLIPISDRARNYAASALAHKSQLLFPFSANQINKRLKRLAHQARIRKSISAHTFRHTFASHLFANGCDLISIRDMLGHSQVETTEIYVRTFTGHLRNELQQFHPRS